MRGHSRILAIHPALPVIWSATFGILAICNVVLVDSLSDVAERSLVLQLWIAKPRLALGVGFTIGLVLFCMEKRKLRHDIADRDNIKALALRLQLPASERRASRRACWKPGSLKWALAGVILAVVLACAFRFSLKVCLYGLLIPRAILYPEYRRMYESVFAELASSGNRDSDRTNGWQVLRKKARTAVAAIAMILGSILVVLAYLVIKATF